MPGNFTPPPTLVDGNPYRAIDHNTAWQTIYNNMTAGGVDDLSTTVAEMQSTVDPGELGSESLPTSVAGELQRLRHALVEMKATAYWYQTTTTRVRDLDILCLDGSNAVVRPLLVNGATRTLRASWRLPLSRVPDTSLIFFAWLTAGVGTGTAILTYDVTRRRVGAAATSLHSGNANLVDSGTNMLLHTVVTITDAGLVWQQGDIIDLTLVRDGGNGSDTLEGDITPSLLGLQYTAYAGRP